jgi:ABC-type transport system involved in multi-copper enzyme maturation permease subunit
MSKDAVIQASDLTKFYGEILAVDHINFEMQLGSLKRLLLAPISLPSVLLGKVFGGVIFGLMMTTVVTIGSVVILRVHSIPTLSYFNHYSVASGFFIP